MIDKLSLMCDTLKLNLIRVGYPLPPPMSFEANKLKQIETCVRHISQVLLGSSTSLFENVSRLTWHVTGRFYVVSNLKEMHEALTYLGDYVKRYNP